MVSKIVGPFWQADVDVVELADPMKNRALRTLFVENTTLDGQIERRATTLLMLADVREVRVDGLVEGVESYTWNRESVEPDVRPASYEELEDALRAGSLSLLLVESDDVRQAGDTRQYTCLAGEIGLDRLLPESNARGRLYQDLDLEERDPGQRSGAEALPGALAVHGSGLSIYGQVGLVWQETAIAAPFLLTRLQPGPGARLLLEEERLTSAERQALVQAWQALGATVNPCKPLYDSDECERPAPHWVTLELANPQNVPYLYWEWDPAADPKPTLRIRGDQFDLLLSDQRPYNQSCPPTSMARIALGSFSLGPADDGFRLETQATVGVGGLPDDVGVRYAYAAADTQTERFELSKVTVAYDPLLTPRFLRDHQVLPEPEWLGSGPDGKADAVDPAILWGHVPLADGWAQLPVPNLTEQIYLDAELEAFEHAPADTAGGLLQGAVAYGNDNCQLTAGHPSEQPWNITLTGAGGAAGRWAVSGTPGDFRLSGVVLEITDPRLVVNGLFWLSTGRSTAGDALPDLEDWTSSLESIPLRVLDPARDLFPPLVTMDLAGPDQAGPIHVALRQEKGVVVEAEGDGEEEVAVSATLGAWSLSYRINGDLLQRMVGKGVLAQDAFSRYLPWVWRRHRTLPMIQALPLTQSQSPPNHPSASRQLVPFQVPLEPAPIVGVPGPAAGEEAPNGAATWPELLSGASPSEDWQSLADLPLVALSLPGIVLDPSPPRPGLSVDEATELPVQYRFDLPYTDEINALAQLPEIVTDPEQVSPLPDSPPPEPPPPLTRETFETHWARLSEQASLAAADAVEAVEEEGGQKVVRHLVEPFDWPVTPDLDLSTYPGSLILGDDNGSLVLSEVNALRGITGAFADGDTGGQIQIAAESEENPYRVEAGSMAAYRDEDGAFRDQRGLWRGASSLPEGAGLIRTPVQFQKTNTAQKVAYELTSSLTPFKLVLDKPDEDCWQIWFRDLPARQQDGTFARGERAQDVNDPELLSRERDYLSGYEWRLGRAGKAQPEATPGGEGVDARGVAPLPLFGLDFYPLTLERAVLAEDRLDRVEVVGRLQLPLQERCELVDLSNAVRLIFEFDPGEEQLRLQEVTLESKAGEWPLALVRGEDSGAPRLEWDQVALAGGKIQVSQVRLRFFLFGVEWTHLLGTLAFPLDEPELTFPLPETADPGLQPKELRLTPNPLPAEYDLRLRLSVKLGKSGGIAATTRFQAEIDYNLLGTGAGTATLRSVALFEDLQWAGEETHSISVGGGAVQFDFQLSQTPGLQLLPGMELDTGRSAPGFAALAFKAMATPGGLPELPLTSAFVEALLSCHWGQGLQDLAFGEAGEELGETQAFGSSSGDLVFGYTTQLRAGGWDESVLLNGVLEIKNLISWPAPWTQPEATPPDRLALPPVAPNDTLYHSRHTVRILFNQHQAPGDSLVTSPEPGLLFTLHAEHAWQFLAVVEHQLADIEASADWQALTARADRRWTALQEVRLLGPTRLGRFLGGRGDPRETAPIPENGGFPTTLDYGYLGDAIRTQMDATLNALPETMLFVEASAPHWIDGQPLEGVQPTVLQYLPNGSQHGALSQPQDYAPSDPMDPRWLLVPMPFLGRLQGAGHDFPPEEGEPNALQVDPIRLLHRRGTSAPPLAWAFSHRRQPDATPTEVIVSGFDTALGRTWARLDPTALEENWFRLQNPVAEERVETIQSVLAARPDSPARLSRATALRRAMDAFRPFYPPDTPDSLALLVVGSGEDLVWRRKSLMTLQGIRLLEGQEHPGENLVDNGTFEPEPTKPHPLTLIGSEWEWAVVDDRVPNAWEVYEFAHLGRHYSGQSSTGWNHTQISLDPPPPLPAGRRDWGLPRMRTPNPDEVKPKGPLSRGKSWLMYTDADKPFWIKVGQSVTLPPGRYRFSLSVFPAQESSGVPPTDPEASQVVLFAGTQNRSRILDGSDLPFDHWGRAELEFEVTSTRTLRLGAELHGPGSFLRNGWYLNDAELVRLVDLPEGWHLTATQLRGIRTRPDGAGGPQRHAAATLMPAQLTIDGQDNPRPLSFAVSPYLGLEFRPAVGTFVPRLASVELLCLDGASSLLRPAATKLWETADGSIEARQEEIQAWARETHRRLCPESPIAVLRYRQIEEASEQAGEPAASLITAYRFAIVQDLVLPEALARRVFSLRTKAAELRFREGQFGGEVMPESVAPFELAPPQTTGVQPLYLTERPQAARSSPWPWGLSALRLSVQYTADKEGVIGQRAEPPEGGNEDRLVTLWWQAPQHLVQYRTNSTAGRPAWGLPALYRAQAIKSLLPTLPGLPLPVLDLSAAGQQGWQPVLPGALRYLISGARPGVLFAIRNQLLRQRGLVPGTAGQVGLGLVSGSVPVQHRMPRPVPLPTNQDPDKALQPWSSYFAPERNLLITPSPADEAFFAACGGFPAFRLWFRLMEPLQGGLMQGWDGKLVFEIEVEVPPGDLSGMPAIVVLDWVQFEITDGESTLACSLEQKEGRYHCTLPTDKAKRLLEGKVAGQILTANAYVGHDTGTDGYRQILSFPLRFIDRNRLALPLEPYFLHFEDPEYNRRLSSPAAVASANVKETVGDNDELHTVTLAADRREYNADSRLALRHDWDDQEAWEKLADPPERTAEIRFQRVDSDGIAHDLVVDLVLDLDAVELAVLSPAPGSLVQITLQDLHQAKEAVRWEPGDVLQIQATVLGTLVSESKEIKLEARIVETPVIPTPEAAYGLLRWQHGGEEVECVRFAWGPSASRIELICPEDLRTEVVRRRAVFHWQDSVRPGMLAGYAIQKIALNGSTHFPEPELPA